MGAGVRASMGYHFARASSPRLRRDCNAAAMHSPQHAACGYVHIYARMRARAYVCVCVPCVCVCALALACVRATTVVRLCTCAPAAMPAVRS